MTSEFSYLQDQKAIIALEPDDLPLNYGRDILDILVLDPGSLFLYWEISTATRRKAQAFFGKDLFPETQLTFKVIRMDDLQAPPLIRQDVSGPVRSWLLNIPSPRPYKTPLLGSIEYYSPASCFLITHSKPFVLPAPSSQSPDPDYPPIKALYERIKRIKGS